MFKQRDRLLDERERVKEGAVAGQFTLHCILQSIELQRNVNLVVVAVVVVVFVVNDGR